MRRNLLLKWIVAVSVIALTVWLVFSRKVYLRVDMSADKRYSLSDATKTLLRDMKEPMTLNLYLTGDLDVNMMRLGKATEDMLYEMDMVAGERLHLNLIDPNDAANEEERYAHYDALEARGLTGMTTTRRGRGGRITEQIIFPWAELCGHRDTVAICLMQPSSRQSEEVSVNAAVEDLEFQLADAVRLLNRSCIKKVAFIDGHNELPEELVYDASDALSRYFQVDRGVLGTDASILDDYAAIIVAKPTEKYSETDKYIIDRYIMHGGRVLWMIDGARSSEDMLSDAGSTPLVALDVNLGDQLFRYGVRITPSVVEDMQCAYMPVNVARPGETPRFEPIPWFFTPLLQTSPYHPITKNISTVKADFASGIEIVGDTVGVRKEVLLATSNASRVHFAPTQIDVSAAVQVEPSEYFNTAFVPVAVALEGCFQSIYKYRMIPDGIVNTGNPVYLSEKTRMVVVADGDIIRNDLEQHAEGLMVVPLGYDRLTRQMYGNRDFIVNTVLYLTDDEGIMELRKKNMALRLLNRAKVETMRTQVVVLNTVLPVLMLALFGLFYFIVRKRRYGTHFVR